MRKLWLRQKKWSWKAKHYHFKGSDYVVTVGWFDCQIKVISADTLEIVMQDKL